MAIDIGRVNYQKHSDMLGGKDQHGNSLPKWEEIGQKNQDAWRHAACAVLSYIDKERFHYLWSLDQNPEDILEG